MKKFFALLLMLVGVLSLAACRGGDDNGDDVDPDQAKVDEAYTRADTLFVDTGSITNSFNLPKTMLTDVSVIWESSNTDVINFEARDNDFRAHVTRPDAGEPNVTLEITGTFTLNDVTRTRTWNVTVVAFPEADIYTDFSELFENANVGDDIEVEGIVVATFATGYFITDGTLNFGVYAPSGIEAQVGDKVNLVGSYTNYHSLYQIDNVTETIISSGNAFDLNVTEISLEDLRALDSSDRSLAGQAFRVTGIINYRMYGQYENIAIESGSHYGQIYFRSNSESLAAIEEFIGQMVTIDVIYYTDHSTDGMYLMFWGTEDDITVSEMTAEDMAIAAAADLELGFTDWIYANLDLPEAGLHGSTISWASNNDAVIAADGTVTRATDSTEVTLTATVTVGSESVTKEFVVTVADADFDPWTNSSSVADVIAEVDGEIVVIQGIVTSYRTFGGGFYIQDEDGTSIFVTGNHTVTPGEKVVVYGEKDTYDDWGNNRPQVINTAVLENDEGDHVITVITGMTLADIIEDHPNSQSRRYRVELAEFIDISSFNEFMMVGNVDMYAFFDVRNYGGYLNDLLEAGDTLQWIEFTVSEISFDNLKLEGVVFPELTEADIETLLNIPTETAADLELLDELTVTTNYVEGPVTYTIDWASNDESVIALDGSVTRPEIGEPDAVVELTATVTLGEETMTFVYTVTVAARQEAPSGGLAYDFDFTNLTTATGYVSEPTDLELVNAIDTNDYIITRLNANISSPTDQEDTGIVLGIRGGNDFEDAWLQTGFSVQNLTHIEFTFQNWTADLDYNYEAFIASFEVQVSTDGENWTTVADLTNDVDTGVGAVNTFTVDMTGVEGAVYIRIILVSEDGIDPDPSWASVRIAFKNLKIFVE